MKGEKIMKKKILSVMICAVMIFALVPLAVSADMGPKPSVRVQITGLSGEYYVTLLSLQSSTGPQSAWDGTDRYASYHEGDKDYDIWKTFVEYEDADGYYFLQVFSKCRGEDEFAWTYYPPDNFKVIIYVPETGEFIESDICERYAFDSYFLFDVGEESVSATGTIEKNYDYTLETVSLIARIVLTIAFEFGIALLFGYRSKNQLVFIGVTNVVTQIALNVTLNVVNFYNGQWSFVAWYVFLEICVFTLEAVLYYAKLNVLGQKPKKRWLAAVYALAANAGSFAVGLGIAHLIPGIF